MSSVTQRIKKIKQPRGGYIKPSQFKLQKIDDYNFIVDGNYLIDDLDDELDLKLDNVNHDTISGFVLHLLGEIPDDNQERSVTYENLTFKITGVKGNRVTKIKLTIKKSEEKESDSSED